MGFLKKVAALAYIAVLVDVAVWAAGSVRYNEVVQLEYADGMYLLPGYSGGKYYKEISDNVCQCDLATFSDIVYLMLDDGFSVYDYAASDDSIDIMLCKKDEFYRLYYKEDRTLTVIANSYENSYIPLTYISRESK